MSKTAKMLGDRQIKKARDQEKHQFLSRKINDFNLTIHGTRLEPLISQLYQELDNAGISFKPRAYLSDEWGCPTGIPIIGVPFYLVDLKLCSLEKQMTGIEAENDTEILMYLRHESGHAFNYAYRLYEKPEWRTTFGRFSEPYHEEYKPIPFSTKFVRHVPAWYAQKHPDDDFAETFAVWLTPGSAWRETYSGTPALVKLAYVDKVVRKYGKLPLVVSVTRLDTPVQDMSITLDSWYQTCREAYNIRLTLPSTIDNDLRCLFLSKKGQSAAYLIESNRWFLVKHVNSWTGVDRHIVAGIVNEITERVKFLDLKTDYHQKASDLANVSVFVTTLAMNYLCHGEFVPS